MKLLDTRASSALVMGVVAIGAIYLFKKSISDGAAAAAQSINPVNKDNIFASGVNSIGEVLTGDKNFTLGGWIYDVANGTPEQQAQRAAERERLQYYWQGNPTR